MWSYLGRLWSFCNLQIKKLFKVYCYNCGTTQPEFWITQFDNNGNHKDICTVCWTDLRTEE